MCPKISFWSNLVESTFQNDKRRRSRSVCPMDDDWVIDQKCWLLFILSSGWFLSLPLFLRRLDRLLQTDVAITTWFFLFFVREWCESNLLSSFDMSSSLSQFDLSDEWKMTKCTHIYRMSFNTNSNCSQSSMRVERAKDIFPLCSSPLRTVNVSYFLLDTFCSSRLIAEDKGNEDDERARVHFQIRSSTQFSDVLFPSFFNSRREKTRLHH